MKARLADVLRRFGALMQAALDVLLLHAAMFISNIATWSFPRPRKGLASGSTGTLL